jgi:phenylalanyl-tRNA synthetase alpha chain
MVDVEEVKKEFQKDIVNVSSIGENEALHIKYLGRNGLINELLTEIKNKPHSEKKTYGLQVNLTKKIVEEGINKKTQELSSKKSNIFFDKTLPGTAYPKGSLHIMTYAVEEITRIFEKIGFIRNSYPEIEWEYFSFESLNMPKGHPARDDFETFFINSPAHLKFGKMVLTPHTSSGQNREMKRLGKPPIRMINIAKTYRPNWDVTHTPMFHQFEGLCVDKDINITHLKGTIDYFAKEFFGKNREIRLRPFHFQFTEPSFEIDVSCGVCNGKGDGCKVCKSGWLELGGAGMVHPNVLKEGGIDPEIYSGWAFGFGPERCMMMREGLKIEDIRVLYSGDIRFLEQF